MTQRDAEATAAHAEDVAAIGGAVVEVEAVGRTVPSNRANDEIEHVLLAFLVAGFDGDDVARCVVEHRVDAHGPLLAVDDDGGGVADVAVPQRAGPLGLPAQTRLGRAAVTHRDSIEAQLAVEALNARCGDGPGVETAVADEGAQDQRHRRRRELAPDVDEQRALLSRELSASATVAATTWLEPVEASMLVA